MTNNTSPEQKSVKERVVKFSTYKRGLRFFSISTALATILTMSIAISAYNKNKDYNEQVEVDKYITEQLGNEQFGDIVSMYKYRVNNNEGFAYDLYRMSEKIVEVDPAYFDIVIYSAYKNMEYKDGNLDDLFNEINRKLENIKETNPEIYYKMKDVKSFEDYLRKLKFVDKEGNIVIEAYETYGEGLNESHNKTIKNNTLK